jgi:hypothetical protein
LGERTTPVTPPPTPVRADPEAVDYTRPPPQTMAAPNQQGYYDWTQDDRPVSESTTTRPLIPVSTKRPQKLEAGKKIDWLLWLGVLIVALGTSVAAMLLLPRLNN